MSSVSSVAARASGRKRSAKKKEPAELQPQPRVSPYTGVDDDSKWSALSTSMAPKKKGGGASRRGSHRMSDGPGCEVRWYWSYHAKIQPAKGNYYMDFGTLVHSGLAYHYAEKMARKPEWFIEQPSVEVQMEIDALGNPDWLRNAEALMAAYKRYYDSDPWEPVYNEEEFEATVEEIDPEGEDEPAIEFEYVGFCPGVLELEDNKPCGNYDEHGNHIPHQVPRMLRLPRLNEEIVTCRPDLIVRRNGRLYIVDHKTQGAARNGSGRLPVINPERPDYTYAWQAMVNLHIVRKGRCAVVPDVEQLEIAGFEFNRVKRELPFDFSRDSFDVPGRLYSKVPKTMRQCVKDERAVAIKCAKDPGALVAHPWECEAKWKCSYTRLCHVDSLEERNIRMNSEYLPKV